MALKGLFGKSGRNDLMEMEETDYLEIDETREERRGVMIKIETMTEFADTDKIQQEIRNGNIVFVKIRSLKEKDMAELRRCVDRLRKTCIALNGDIAGIDEDFIILAPEGVEIHRKEAQ